MNHWDTHEHVLRKGIQYLSRDSYEWEWGNIKYETIIYIACFIAQHTLNFFADFENWLWFHLRLVYHGSRCFQDKARRAHCHHDRTRTQTIGFNRQSSTLTLVAGRCHSDILKTPDNNIRGWWLESGLVWGCVFRASKVTFSVLTVLVELRKSSFFCDFFPLDFRLQLQCTTHLMYKPENTSFTLLSHES